MEILLLVVSLFLFTGLVAVHEWGHFITARRNGVDVEEFAIFFGPSLYKKKTKQGWIFSIRAIPLGGFVKLKGEHDSDTEPGSFGAASLWTKSKIMAAGVVMNLVAALVLLTILALIGMPKIIPNQFTIKSDTHVLQKEVLVGQVDTNTPAAKAGVKAEDVLISIGLPGHKPVLISDSTKLRTITKSFAGQNVVVTYSRAGEHHTTRATLLSAKEVDASTNTYNPKGYLGIVPTSFETQRSTWSAPVVAVGLSTQVTVLTFQGLGHAVGGLGSLIAGAVTGNTVARQNGQTSASSQVAGPVGLFFILKAGSFLGYQFMLFIIAIISLTLAIMNILPIPALDGGRLWITLIARGFKRPLSAPVEEAVNMAGFIVLFCLIILVSFVDVKRFL